MSSQVESYNSTLHAPSWIKHSNVQAPIMVGTIRRQQPSRESDLLSDQGFSKSQPEGRGRSLARRIVSAPRMFRCGSGLPPSIWLKKQLRKKWSATAVFATAGIKALRLPGLLSMSPAGGSSKCRFRLPVAPTWPLLAGIAQQDGLGHVSALLLHMCFCSFKASQLCRVRLCESGDVGLKLTAAWADMRAKPWPTGPSLIDSVSDNRALTGLRGSAPVCHSQCTQSPI